MSVVLVTGAAGLIGSEACRHFASQGLDVVGVDNNMRQRFFGAEASTEWQRKQLERDLFSHYYHADIDIRDDSSIDRLFEHYGEAISLVVHTAAQPSHDWAGANLKRISQSTPWGRLIYSKPRAAILQMPHSSLRQRTRSTVTRRTGCHSSNTTHAGKSTKPLRIPQGYGKT